MWYHASLSTGHAAKADEPIIDIIRRGELPPLGWDQDLLWKSRITEAFQTYITEQGLDGEGKEYVCIVAPRYTDLGHTFNRVLTGNESTAGSFIGDTPASTSTKIVRSVLYPAIIYASEYRNYTTSSLMNYEFAGVQTLNNGQRINVANAPQVKQAFSIMGRDYRGHVYWENLLLEFNRGATVYYYTGHGTGGGGVSAQPAWGAPNEDGWKGYTYANNGLPRDPSGMWFDVEGANQYELAHFYYCDLYWENIHNMYVHFSSCTTAWHTAPDIYMNHGCVAYYGNCGTGIGGINDAWDAVLLERAVSEGLSLGEANSLDMWKWDRDYTTLDPESIYGSMSLRMLSLSVYFGDPGLYIYVPNVWTEPIPVDGLI